MCRLTRREFLIAVGLAALETPFAAFGQGKGKVWRIGFLTARSRPASMDTGYAGTFRQALRELGYVEGKNVELEWRFADGKYELLPKSAAELVSRKVDVIVTMATPATRAAQQATKTIPIVMTGTGDPVGSGFINTLRHPGGNITGVTNINGDVNAKRVEMLVAILPKASIFAVMLNPANPTHGSNLKAFEAAAQKAKVRLLRLDASTPDGIEQAFAVMKKRSVDALIVQTDPFFTTQRRQIVQLAEKASLPAFYGAREPVEAGGLMSYSSGGGDSMRRAAFYVDKIFKGAKPAELPVEQPTRLELVINLKAAKALGITIPQSVLVRADRVIE